jgi:CheY-like chemotaxis protein
VITTPDRRAAIVLAVHDVEETRHGIEQLLAVDGYRVVLARNEDDAVYQARRQRPDLILVSLGGRHFDVLLAAARIQQRAELSDNVPVVVFYVPTIPEGAEVALANNLYLTRPDNFDQLRGLLARLIRTSS